MPNQTKNFQATIFDRAFVDIIEHLSKHKKDIQKFKTKKELLESLDIAPSNYVEIKNGNRGVPQSKIEKVIRVLSSKYDVREAYFKFREGSMTNKPITPAEEDQKKYLTLREENMSLKKDLEKERAIIVELRDMISMQKKIIDSLKPGKKTGQ